MIAWTWNQRIHAWTGYALNGLLLLTVYEAVNGWGAVIEGRLSEGVGNPDALHWPTECAAKAACERRLRQILDAALSEVMQ